MKTILFLNNQYIDSLNSLRQLFKGNISSSLRRDLLCAFQDGVISQWLGEGDEECNTAKLALDKIDLNLSNQEYFELLMNLFANDSQEHPSDSQIKFENHCQIENVKCCKLDKDDRPITQFEDVTKQPFKFKREECLNFQILFGIKITSPDNENIHLKSTITKGDTIEKETFINFSINTKKNEVKHVIQNVYLKNFCNYRISLSQREDVLWEKTIYNGNIKIKLGELIIPFIFVEGECNMKGFYIMSYPMISQGQDMYPQTNVSYNEIRKQIKDFKQLYNIELRLPKLKEWRFAAKGGICNQSTTYAGSNIIEEVSWYLGNSIRNYWHEVHQVGTKKPNVLGLYDMSGNVWEMTEDISKDNERERIICGGSFNSSAEECKINQISTIGRSNERRNDVGFRFVCDVDSFEKIDPKYIISE